MSNVQPIRQDRRLLWTSSLHGYGGGVTEPKIHIVLPDGRVQLLKSGGDEMLMIDLSHEESIAALEGIVAELRARGR
ncbi:hypothetical protein IB262_21225 [Ensifer sp. ENS02]|uniref:hypothetical protein n=1 Tax=Ensifer sp. ENS02 TaxID=2769290 RepID=UPI00177D5127|nr:hypothetical protein [Ensifer sp. ENS02]MBD9522421.1 hypothetical protein [Ensifer sp. ENS02]